MKLQNFRKQLNCFDACRGLLLHTFYLSLFLSSLIFVYLSLTLMNCEHLKTKTERNTLLVKTKIVYKRGFKPINTRCEYLFDADTLLSIGSYMYYPHRIKTYTKWPCQSVRSIALPVTPQFINQLFLCLRLKSICQPPNLIFPTKYPQYNISICHGLKIKMQS